MILSDFSVRRPVATGVLFAGLALLGTISWLKLPVQLFPELVYPEVYVTLTLPGASPEQMERELIRPTEAAVGRLSGVVEMESYALANAGGVRVAYGPDVDMKFALLQLEAAVNRLTATFPERSRSNVRRFDLGDISSFIMQLDVLGDRDLNALRDFAEEHIKPELEAVDGVVNAAVLGGRSSAVEIVIDPVLCQAHGLTMGQVRSKLNAANRRRQFLGKVYNTGKAYPVSLQGQFDDLKQIEGLLLLPESSLRLGDVATIREGLLEQTDRHRVNGKPSVGIRVQKDDDANLIAVEAQARQVVDRLNAIYADEGIEIGVTSSQADLMNEALSTLKQAAVLGALLGLVVLYLFLRQLRFVGVLLLAIPASLLITFNLMYVWGLSVNVLSLCGLALAIGMLTDNSIVVMESIFKHYERGKQAADAARDGTAEVSKAVLAATATTVSVFLPVVFVQSDAQDLLRELALSMTFPILASLAVALTLVPALSARSLSLATRRPVVTGRLMSRYVVILKACLRHRLRVVLAVGLVLTSTLVAAFFLVLQQDAAREETQFTVYVDLPEGATLEATDEVVAHVEEAVGEVEGLKRYVTTVQENQASVVVMLEKRTARPGEITVDEIKRKLDERMTEIRGGVVGYEPKPRAGRGGRGRGVGGRRRSSGFNLTGQEEPEMAVIRGYDFGILQMIADDVVYRLEGLEEIQPNSVRADAESGAPEVHVLASADAMFDQRMNAGEVLQSIGDASLDGFQTAVPYLSSDATERPIQVRNVAFADGQEPGLNQLRETPIRTQQGRFVSLSEVAQVRMDQGRSSILRTDQSRRVVVFYRFSDEVRDSQPLVEAARGTVQDVVNDVVLPPGYAIEVVEAEVDTVYYWMMGIAALLIYMILASLFESFGSPVIILCTLPPAVIGSCWALMLTGTGLSQQGGPMALLGFIVLLGIAVNNGIILIDAIATYRNRHGYRRERAVLAAGVSRVRPILMTSATTLLGVLPLALESGVDYEIWPAFAITVLGGLSVSMASTLVFIPIIYMGLDQMVRWLRDIGGVGVILATTAAASATYGVYVRYESTFWACLAALPFWLGFLGCVWVAVQVHRARREATRLAGPITTIQLRNLTKVYGAPGRFRREWDRLRRSDTNTVTSFRESLWGKLPVLALLIYFAYYLEDGVWIYANAALLALTLAHFWRHGRKVRSRPSGRWRRLAGQVLPLMLFTAYIHTRLGLMSVSLATVGAWAGFLVVRAMATRVRSGSVDLERMSGRIVWLRRGAYRAASAMPLVGVPKPQHVALRGVDLEIRTGMFGLLGPNGAGKTTLMRILCQVLEPSYGSIQINGQNLMRLPPQNGLIGYLPQHFGQYDHLTVYGFLEYRALLEGFNSRKERQHRVDACLAQVNLSDRAQDRIGSLSGGMRQRVGIAQTLLHMPRIIVVDEPTAGLDPLERIRFRNLLARVSQDRIVVFSTHIVEDISGSCNRLAVLNAGSLLYSGTPQSMRRLAAGKVWEAVLEESEFRDLEAGLNLISHVRTPGGVRARFLAESSPDTFASLEADPTLEDAYLYLLHAGRAA